MVDEVPLTRYFAAFVICLMVFGWLYSALTPYGHGVGDQDGPLPWLSFLNGLYFSVVTVSSLGYGDLHPLGYSKPLACVEVLFGLAFMGVVVAKVTSRRISHHVRRLFSSDAQKRLDEFSEKFGAVETSLAESMRSLGRIFQRTPEASQISENRGQIITSFRGSLSALQSTSISLHGYLSLEVEQDDYFSIAPSESMRRVGRSMDKVAFQLGQLVISLPPEARVEVLDGNSRQLISETIRTQQACCDLVAKYAKDTETKECFARISATCAMVLESFFAAPRGAEPPAQPDQVAQRPNSPQEPSQQG